MKLIKRSLPLDHNLFLFGDDHEGTILRHDGGWNQLIDMLNSPYAGLPASRNFAVDHGDIIEAITIDDPRYDGQTGLANILAQMAMAVKHRQLIKKKLICILDGNHPKKLWRWTGHINQNAAKRADAYTVSGLTEYICRELGVQSGTWTAKITITNGKADHLQYKHFATHGHGSINSIADDPGRRESNMLLSLKRKLMHKSGDAVLMSMGHTHKLLINSPHSQLYLIDDGESVGHRYSGPRKTTGYIHPDYRWYVNTGSFYRLYGEDGMTGYAEQAGYDPIELGFCVAIIRGGKIEGIKKVTI